MDNYVIRNNPDAAAEVIAVESFDSTPPRNEFKRRATLLGVGAISNQIFQAVTVPIIGRLYGPRLYGEWALLLSIGMIIATVAGLRYEQAVVVAEDGTEAIDTSLVQIYTTVLVAGIVLAAILWIPPSAYGHVTLSKVWLAAAPMLGVLIAISYLTTSCFVRLKRFGAIAAVTLVQATVMAIAQIGGAFIFHRSFRGLVYGGIAGCLVPLGVLLVLAWGPRRRIIRQMLLTDQTIRAARKHINFAKYLSPQAFVAALRERGFVILLSAFTSSVITGYYSLALRLVWAPQTLANQSMRTVIYQRAAEEKDVSRLAPLVRGVLTKMVLLGAPAFAFLAWWATPLLTMLVGPQWRGTGPFVVALCAPALTFLLQGWMTLLLSAVGSQHAGFFVELGYTAVGIGVFTAILARGGSGLLAVEIVSVITVVYNLVFLVVDYKMCHFPSKDLFRVLGLLVLVGTASLLALASTAALLPQKRAICATFVFLTAYAGWLAKRWRGRSRHTPVPRPA